MSGVAHNTRIGSIGIKSGSIGITDGNIRVTSGSIDASIIGTVPVTGAFYPGSQKVYGDIEIGTVPVTGAFYPGTQAISGSVGIKAPIDALTGGIPTITTPHHEVHEGEMFELGHIFQDVGNNNNAEILIINSGTYELHTTFHLVTGGEAFAYLYEGPAISSNGTALTIYDMNRTTNNNPTSLAYYGPTISNTGTLLTSSLIEGGDAGRAIGGQIRNMTEWIFKKSTRYLVRVTNKAGVNKHISIASDFYEVA